MRSDVGQYHRVLPLCFPQMAWDIGGPVIEDLEFSGPALGVVFRF